MFARHGFQSLAVRAKLGRFVLDRILSHEYEHLSAPERVRLSFEQLGPTFVKLGQLLATRPDLIPPEFSEEFRKLHDQVAGIPFKDVREILVAHFGAPLNEVFESFDEQPLAAASIAQVHRARLRDGSKVVVKVQRPGVEQIISEDLKILKGLAELAEKYIPESRVINPTGIVREFGRAMELETNFIIEANNIRRFHQNFSRDPNIKIPRVYNEFTGRRVLVMEMLEGIPLTHRGALEQEGIDPEMVVRRGLKAYLKMVYTDGIFHGDLHAGNILVLPNNQIGLIDFGIVGRLNRNTQSSIANIFMALAEEDYERVAYVYVDLAPFTEAVDVDQFARDLRDLIAPYFGLTMKNINVGRLLMDSTAVAAKHGLTLPAELVLYFKSVMALEGMGRMILPDFDFLSYSMEFAKELVQSKADPKRLLSEAALVARDINGLVNTLPRQLKQLMRRINDPDFTIRVHNTDAELLQHSLDKGFRQIFWGLIWAAIILGVILKFDDWYFR